MMKTRTLLIACLIALAGVLLAVHFLPHETVRITTEGPQYLAGVSKP